MRIKNSIECYVIKPSVDSICEVLLLHKPETERHPSFWQPVTGGIENRESPEDACVREVFEETGIRLTPSKITDMDFHFEIKMDEEDILIKKTLFCTTLLEDNVTVNISSEHDTYKWVSFDLVYPNLFWESNKNTFHHFYKSFKITQNLNY